MRLWKDKYESIMLIIGFKLQNNIWIERVLGKRNNINGFPPHSSQGWRNRVNKVILRTFSCNCREEEINHEIKRILANIP
jgi:hypothetical protein